MTDLMERTGAVEAVQCAAERHSDSDHAWRAWNCRCEGAVKAHNRSLQLKLEWKRAHRQAEKIRADLRAKEDPSRKPPANQWRRPESRVSMITVLHIVAGYRPAGTTQAERRIACHLLARRRDPLNGLRLAHKEIGLIVGISDDTVATHLDRHREHRRTRHLRRLADAKTRAFRAETARLKGRGYDRSGHRPPAAAGDLGINEATNDAMANKISKGFNVTSTAMEFRLLGDELKEALTAWREEPDNLGAELADVFIYVASIARINGIDLAQAVRDKLAVNRSRTYRRDSETGAWTKEEGR